MWKDIPEVEREGPPPVQLHLRHHVADVPSKELIHEHPARVHVAGKACVLPQGQLPPHLLPCLAPCSCLHLYDLR